MIAPLLHWPGFSGILPRSARGSVPARFSRNHGRMPRALLSLLLTCIVVSVGPGAAIADASPALSVGPSASPAPWQWPVAEPHSIVRQYLSPATPYSAGHRGIDVRVPGDVVYTPADGVVHFAGTVVDRPVLSIEHPGGVISSYEPVVTDLHAGDVVARGDAIGTVIAGHCSTVCLHFGVRVDGQYVSPLLYIGMVPPSVLLPTRWG